MAISAKLVSILTTGFRGQDFKGLSYAISHARRRIKFLLAIFVEGHLVAISAKLVSILTNGFRGEHV